MIIETTVKELKDKLSQYDDEQKVIMYGDAYLSMVVVDGNNVNIHDKSISHVLYEKVDE